MKKLINSIFNNNITYFDYARTGVLYLTDNSEELEILKKEGWKISAYKNKFRCNPPSVYLIDITDIKKIMYHNNTIFTYALYMFVKNLMKNKKLNCFIDSILINRSIYYKNFSYHISVGPILTTTLIIEGTDKRINTLKRDFILKFTMDPLYNFYYNKAKEKLINNKFVKKIKNNLFNEYYNFFDQIIINNSKNKKFKIQKEYYQLDTTLLNFYNYDVIIFIPNGCYKFMYSFINKDTVNKIMFWEIHLDKTKEGNNKFLEKDLRNKNVLVIDSIYSGKTLIYMKNMLTKLNSSSKILGLFPKDKSVLNLLDYVCIGNKILEVANIKEDTLEKMFVNVIKEV